MKSRPASSPWCSGPSGSGKTTLCNIIGGIESATSGTVTVGGEEIGERKPADLGDFRRHHVGFVFQFFNLIPTLTARENIEVIIELTGQGRQGRLPTLLDAVGLADRADNFPSQLSGGQQQRVALARALATDPAILLADEPTGALDLDTGRQILGLLQDLRDQGRTVIVITHNASVGQIADRVITVVDGRIESIEDNDTPAAAADRHVVIAMRATTRKSLRDLARQRAQVDAVGVTILLGVMLYVATAGAFLNLSDSYQQTYDRLQLRGPRRHRHRPAGSGRCRPRRRRHGRHHAHPGGPADADRRHGARGPRHLPARQRPSRRGRRGRHRGLLPRPGRHRPGAASKSTPRTRSASRLATLSRCSATARGTRPRCRASCVSPEYIWAARSRQEVIADPKSFAVVFAPRERRDAVDGPRPTRRSSSCPPADEGRRDGPVASAMRDAGAHDVITWRDQASQATLQEDLNGFNEMSIAFPLLFLTAAGVPPT